MKKNQTPPPPCQIHNVVPSDISERLLALSGRFGAGSDHVDAADGPPAGVTGGRAHTNSTGVCQ